MADSDELKQMILNFRCSELQVLLGFAGRNKTGRKQELQSRAVELLKLRSTPIQMKIKELHKRYPIMSSSPKSTYPTPTSTINPLPSSGQSLKNSSHYSTHASTPSQLGNHSTAYSSIGPLDYSAKLNAHHHSSSNNTYPVHPDVRFRRLPFYVVLAELLKPASLVPSGSSRFQENNFVFHLTPQQAHDIAISRDIRPGAKLEYVIQVQLRFCLLETSCEQEDNFPPSICVKVNSKMCPLPNPIPTNKPGLEPKRPSRPVNITPLCRLSPTVSNHINVSWASEFGRGFAMAVYLVRRLSSTSLLQQLRVQGVRNADHTRALIKEKLAHDADSEIATTSLRVSLMCPLGKMRMQFPCRATTCTHLQCFDASLYLQMNEKKPTWICPVCDKPAPFDLLVLDGLFLEIFNAAPECNEIQFHEDGSWSPLMPKKEAQLIGSPLPLKQVSSGLPTHTSSSSSSSGGGSSVAKSAEKVEVIDLTCDSSDEDDAPSEKSSSATLQVDTNSSLTSNSSSSLSSVATTASTSNSIGSVSPHIITIDSPSHPNSSSPSLPSSLPSPKRFCESLLSPDALHGSLSARSVTDTTCQQASHQLIRVPELQRFQISRNSDIVSSSSENCPILSSTQPYSLPLSHNNLNSDELLNLGFIDRYPSRSFMTSNPLYLDMDDIYPV